MEEEILALHQNQTWKLVPSQPHFNVLGTKWVFHVKYNPVGSIAKHKVRLVPKEFNQNSGFDFNETYSPIVKASSIKVIISLAVSFGWDIQQIDVNNAFLNGAL